jgi:SAM-dependent methyltransferase
LDDRRPSTHDMRRLHHRLRSLNRRWSHWPGSIVRDPRLTEAHFLQHRRLLLTLAAAVERHLNGCRGLLVVDVGAGRKPYYPLLAAHTRRYVGIDLPGTPDPEVLGVSERLPLRSDSIDVVMSTQMLEHAHDPSRVLGECCRVLRPGGLMFASTHGMSYYHPIPVDHWRWTHTGLRLQFERAGFNVRSVEASGGTLTTLATYVATHFLGAANRFGSEWFASRLLVPFNLVVGALDGVHRAPPKAESELGWGSMPWTYVVVAEKPLA